MISKKLFIYSQITLILLLGLSACGGSGSTPSNPTNNQPTTPDKPNEPSKPIETKEPTSEIADSTLPNPIKNTKPFFVGQSDKAAEQEVLDGVYSTGFTRIIPTFGSDQQIDCGAFAMDAPTCPYIAKLSITDTDGFAIKAWAYQPTQKIWIALETKNIELPIHSEISMFNAGNGWDSFEFLSDSQLQKSALQKDSTGHLIFNIRGIKYQLKAKKTSLNAQNIDAKTSLYSTAAEKYHAALELVNQPYYTAAASGRFTESATTDTNNYRYLSQFIYAHRNKDKPFCMSEGLSSDKGVTFTELGKALVYPLGSVCDTRNSESVLASLSYGVTTLNQHKVIVFEPFDKPSPSDYTSSFLYQPIIFHYGNASVYEGKKYNVGYSIPLNDYVNKEAAEDWLKAYSVDVDFSQLDF